MKTYVNDKMRLFSEYIMLRFFVKEEEEEIEEECYKKMKILEHETLNSV